MFSGGMWEGLSLGKLCIKESLLLINCWWETGREPQSQQSLFNVSGTLLKIILQERKKPRQWDHFWKEILSNSRRIQLHTPTVFPTTNCLRLPWQTYYCSPFSLVHPFPWFTNSAHQQHLKNKRQKITNSLSTTRP